MHASLFGVSYANHTWLDMFINITPLTWPRVGAKRRRHQGTNGDVLDVNIQLEET